MDIALRILHIVFGIFWVGSFAFFLLVLMPQARKLGPAVERSTLKILLSGKADLFVLPSGLICIAAGVTMALRLREVSATTYFSTGWGLAMFIAAIMVILYIINGFLFSRHESRLRKLLSGTEGQKAAEDENEQIERITTRLVRLWRLDLVLLLIAAIAMPIARFV